MTLMAIHTAEWEMKAARRDERQVEAERIRLARMLRSAGETNQPRECSRLQTSPLRKLLIMLGPTRA